MPRAYGNEETGDFSAGLNAGFYPCAIIGVSYVQRPQKDDKTLSMALKFTFVIDGASRTQEQTFFYDIEIDPSSGNINKCFAITNLNMYLDFLKYKGGLSINGEWYNRDDSKIIELDEIENDFMEHLSVAFPQEGQERFAFLCYAYYKYNQAKGKAYFTVDSFCPNDEKRIPKFKANIQKRIASGKLVNHVQEDKPSTPSTPVNPGRSMRL
ncbi:MAG: hypothetical protein EOM67_13325 [Spirochaetia bacterium]|nr:hypothetical protein [Spirochaetia bacterium]